VALFTLRLLPPLLKKGKGRSRRPRFRLSPTSPRHRGGPPAFRAFNVAVLTLNHSGSSAPTRSSKPSLLAPPSGGTERTGKPRDTGSQFLPDGPCSGDFSRSAHADASASANFRRKQRSGSSLQHNGVSADHKRRRFSARTCTRAGKVLSAVTRVKKMPLLEAFAECESPGQHSRGDISARRACTWFLSVLMPIF